MKKFYTLSLSILALMLGQTAIAQNGPGGVGARNSTSDLGLWLKGSEIITNTSNEVTSWKDVSGKSNSANVAGSGVAITFSTNNDFDNKPVAQFNGGKYLKIPDDDKLDGGSGLTVYTVLSPDNLAPNSGKKYFISKPGSGSPYKMYFDNNNLKFDLNSNSPAVTSGVLINNPFNYLLSFEFEGGTTSGDNVFSFVDGNDQATASSTIPDNSLNNNNEPFFIGSKNNSGTDKFNGQIAEIIVFNRELNDAERIIVDNSLGAKYSLNIPTSKDYYAYDSVDFDENVIGVGKAGNDEHLESQVGNLNIAVASGDLDDQDFIFIGSDDVPGQNVICAKDDELSKQTQRVWRFDNRNGSGNNPTDNGIPNFTLKFKVGAFAGAGQSATTFDASYVQLVASTGANFADGNTTSFTADAITGSGGDQQAVFNLTTSDLNRGDYLKFEFGKAIIYDGGSYSNGSGINGEPTTADSGKKLIIKNGTAMLTNDAELLCIVIKDGAELLVGDPNTTPLPEFTVKDDIQLGETGMLDATFGNFTFNGATQQLIRDVDLNNPNDTLVQLMVNNLTLGAGKSKTLNLNTPVDLFGVLEINSGQLVTNGNLTFKSSETKTAVFAEVNPFNVIGNGIDGKVVVERFIPARRAFRFISSSVKTDGTINDNWQEGVHNVAVSGSNFNMNPNPEFGIHITGSQAGNNGFDATPSGNPSLFVFKNLNQGWIAVENTDGIKLSAGKPYRLFVRVSRSVDVTDNQTVPNDTRLRMTGELKIGARSFNNLSPTDGDFNFIGNPYQAQVDMDQLLSTNNSNNLNDGAYIIYDPNINIRGSYVTVPTDGGKPTGTSDANQYLQPNQACFVQTASDGTTPQVVFEEEYKENFTQTTAVFSNNSAPILSVNLYKTEFTEAIDGFIVNFNETYSNEVNSNMDFGKLGNLDENIAIKRNDKFLSIEKHAMPEEGDIIQFYNDQYRSEDYSLNITMENLDGASAVLVDNFLATETDIENGELNYSFMVDQNEEGSIASDRFSIVFGNTSLGIGEEKADEFALYPNPTKNGQFNISLNNKVQGKDATVEVYNIQGQRVFQNTYQNVGNSISVQTENLASGVYLTKVKVGGQDFERKLIVE